MQFSNKLVLHRGYLYKSHYSSTMHKYSNNDSVIIIITLVKNKKCTSLQMAAIINKAFNNTTTIIIIIIPPILVNIIFIQRIILTIDVNHASS